MSILILISVTAITVSNTWAFITNSSETPETTITAGKVQIITDPDTSFMTIEDVSPGSSGTVCQTITNSGNVPGKLEIDFSNFKESIATEVPATTAGKDTLLGSVRINIKLLKASDGTLVKQITQPVSNTIPIKKLEKMSVSNIVVDPNTAYKLVIYYEIPEKTDSGIQGKKLTFDVTYTLSQ